MEVPNHRQVWGDTRRCRIERGEMMKMQECGLRRVRLLERLCPDVPQLRKGCLVHSGEDAIGSARTILIGGGERGRRQQRISSVQSRGAVQWVQVQSCTKGTGVARKSSHLQ